MKLNKDYIIPFVGLKLGVHSFEFNVTDAFFEYFEYSIIHKGEVKVNLSLEKRETMMVGDYTINGVVEAECDRCGDNVNVEIEGDYQLVYKFDNEPSDDESLIIVYPEEFEINVMDSILELIMVSLPSRAVHEDGDCNEEMMAILDEYILVNEEEMEDSDDTSEEDSENDENIDPRWSALKNLKK